jgi:hypothetical protein
VKLPGRRFSVIAAVSVLTARDIEELCEKLSALQVFSEIMM